MSAARSRRNTVMSPEAPIVVYCSLIVVAYCSPLIAAASDNPDTATPKRNFQGIISAEDANPQRYYTTTDGGDAGSCCGYSTVTSFMNERRTREIPLDVIFQLNEVKNISQLFSQFMPDVDLYKAQRIIATTGFQISDRSMPNVERKAPLIPKPASCSLESRTISLKDTDDPSLYYYPPCTRVNRCGGCCAHDLLGCQPTKTETLQFEVMVSQYNEGKLEFKGRKFVSVVQHSTCKCDCIVQPENCNPLQTYFKKECRCVCTNDEDRQKCDEERNAKKLWNPAACACQCVERQDCTTGFSFDYDTCSCEPLRTRTKNTGNEFNRNMYSLGES
ncbi:Cystine-knot cytokine,PDGF/VEGF domain [Cinara cedri]|uniref:Cystine-knot cytokine,PDGF/VEGF domain n=1 Tax=Cinara cedri TaxID=506608 RepID=A0A5E4MUQ2_9HEMI|nr:Cystine-knot cytokine,PDGF/VEGF domain [Cinara cedri]